MAEQGPDCLRDRGCEFKNKTVPGFLRLHDGLEG
jgi:hypothetical protein